MQKLRKTILAALFSEQARNALHVQVFKTKNIILGNQPISEFPLKVIAPELNSTIELGKHYFCPASIMRTAFFVGQRTAKAFSLVMVSFQKQRSLYVVAVAGSQEYFHAEVKSRAFTCRESAHRFFVIRDDDYPEVAAIIPLDGDGLYPSLHLSRLMKPIVFFSDSDLVAIKRVSGLRKCKRLVFTTRFEGWRGGLDRMLAITEKQFVCLVNSPCNILNRLARQFRYPCKLSLFLDFNDMIDHSIDVYGLFEHPVIPPMQGNAMIVQASKLVNLFIQMALSCVGIEFVLVCNHWVLGNQGLRFWFSIRQFILALKGEVFLA